MNVKRSILSDISLLKIYSFFILNQHARSGPDESVQNFDSVEDLVSSDFSSAMVFQQLSLMGRGRRPVKTTPQLHKKDSKRV